MLSARGLILRHDARTLVDALNIELVGGEMLGVLGANGAGKTSLLTVLAGLARPSAGEIELDGQALNKWASRARAQRLGLLPQIDETGFLGSVADFIALGHFPHDFVFEGCAGHLTTWELTALAQRRFDTLSGGERQRARMAQLGVQNPQIYLLDEPLTHLDPAHQARLLTWARAQANAGKTVVLTLHDPNWAAAHCDRLLFLYGDGRWLMGTPATLLSPPALEALYGAGTASLWRLGSTPAAPHQ